jgi:hypothetical protein
MGNAHTGLQNKHISKETGKNAFDSTAERILLQDGKMWPLTEEMKELGWLKLQHKIPSTK